MCLHVFMRAHTSPRLRMSHLFIIFKAYTCCVLRILATATYKTTRSKDGEITCLLKTTSSSDEDVAARWCTYSAHIKDPAESALSPTSGRIKNYSHSALKDLERNICLITTITNVHLSIYIYIRV